jgi:hypothetical protein
LSNRFPNKFTNLAKFPPLPSQLPTYAQKLTASSLKSQSRSNESFSSSQTQASSSSQITLSQAFPSPHFAESLQIIKSPEVNIFPIDQHIEHIQNPKQVVSHMFPLGWYFQPEHPHKSQTFYEFILVDTNSILLTHSKCTLILLELLSQSVSLNKLSVLFNGMVIHVIQDHLVKNLIPKNILL